MVATLEKVALRVLLAVVIVGAAVFLHAGVSYRDIRAEDVNYEFWRGQMIVNGENPYERIIDAGPRAEDQGYPATYFPLFYLLSALTQWLGLREFERWIKVWRFVFALFDVGIASLLVYAFSRRRRVLLGVLAGAFWLLNRWTLHVALAGHLEFVPIFFMVLSLLVFREHRLLSLVLFGVSLALKQVAIFLAPLYVIWVWQESRERRLKAACSGALAIAAVPLIVSLPFIAWNAEAFFRSIFFSAVRRYGAHFEAPSVDEALGLRGLASRIPMLVLMGVVYVCALRRHLGRYLSALLTMVIFTDFHTVLFRQYLCWVVPLIPLAALDLLDGGRVGKGVRKRDQTP